jgi:hypothetical protein
LYDKKKNRVVIFENNNVSEKLTPNKARERVGDGEFDGV